MERMSFQDTPQGLYNGLYQMGTYLDTSGLDRKFLLMVDYYVSVLNHCAFCSDMHFKEAQAAGETTVRLSMVHAWRDTEVFGDSERAVLAYAEAVTTLPLGDIDDVVYGEMKKHFSQDQIAAWTLAIVRINSWNRLMKAFRTKAGEYQVGQFA